MGKADFKVTKRSVEGLQPGAKDAFYWDAEIKGFGVKLTPAGRRTYVFQYRVRGKTAPVRVTIGQHGPITADAARREALRLKAMTAIGRDPVREQREAEREADRLELERLRAEEALAGMTIAKRSKVWLENVKADRPRTYGFYEGIIRNHVLPVIGDVPMPEMKRSDVRRVLDRIPVDQKTLRRNARATLSAFWYWTNDQFLETYDAPLSEVSPFPQQSRSRKKDDALKERDRVLTDSEIKSLWTASAKLVPPFRAFIRLLLLTGQRRSEVAGLDWSELDRDTELWILPPDRSKNGQANKIPLNFLAIAELDRLADGCDWPTKGPVLTTDGVRTLGGFSYIKRLIDDRIESVMGQALDDWHIHDLRRTVATKLQSLKIRFEVNEAILNHRVKRHGSAKPYQQYDWEPEKVTALAALASEVERIISGQDKKNVVPIRRDMAG
jgi:integrase